MAEKGTMGHPWRLEFTLDAIGYRFLYLYKVISSDEFRLTLPKSIMLSKQVGVYEWSHSLNAEVSFCGFRAGTIRPCHLANSQAT